MNPAPDSLFKAEQLSVFLENRAGRLSEVIQAIDLAGINIRAVSLADTSDFGILRMMVSDIALAEKTLKANGFTTGRTNVLAIELPDSAGSLNCLLQLLSSQGINVEYMYAHARRSLANAIMVFRFDKLDKALEILKNSQFTVVSASELERI